MLNKLPKLENWLEEKQKPGLETSFVSGNLLNWVFSKIAQFGIRRLIMLILFSIRYIFCLKKFVWFSWHDLIFQTSLIYLLVGLHYGSLETFKKTFKGLRTARLFTFIICLVLLGFFLPELIYRMIAYDYIPNVFDEARLIIAFKAISQIYRNLENAIQIRRGTPPLPLGRLIGSESLLVLAFVGMVTFFGTSPMVLFWILLLDSVLQEAIQWPWVLSQPYRNKVSWFSFKDFLTRPEINTDLLLSCFVGTLIYSERFLLQGLTTKLGPNAVYYYFFLLPLVSIVWRLPHLFHRYFRKKHGILNNQISFSIFAIVFTFLLITGLIQFIFIIVLLHSNIMLPIVVLLLGPLSAVLAYCWYRGFVLEFLIAIFWMLKLFGLINYLLPAIFTTVLLALFIYRTLREYRWEKGVIKLKKCNSTLVMETVEKKMKTLKKPFIIKNIFGKIYQLNADKEGMKVLKRELFAASLGEIVFNPPLENNLILEKSDQNFIPLASLKMKSVISNDVEAERFLKMIQKSLTSGNKKSIELKKGIVTFGINKFGQYGSIFNKSSHRLE